MEADIKPLENSLVALPPAKRAAVVLGSEKAEAQLKELVAKSADIKTVIDGAGRDEAHRAAMTLRNARTSIVKLGTAAREDATAFSKAIIAEEKRLAAITADEEERILALRDGYDAKVKAEKEAEARAEFERIAAIRAKIDTYRNLPAQSVSDGSEAIGATMHDLALIEVTPEAFAEFLGDAALALREAHEGLEKLRVAAVAREAEAVRVAEERAELARLRAEAEERERVAKELAAEQARLDAIERERMAQLEREAREERERIAKVEADRVAAEQKAEADRLAAEAHVLAEQRAAIAAEMAQLEQARAAAQAVADKLVAEQKAAEDAALSLTQTTEPAPALQARTPEPWTDEDREIVRTPGVRAMSFDHGEGAPLAECPEPGAGQIEPLSSPAAGPVGRIPETRAASPNPPAPSPIDDSVSGVALKFAVTTLLSEGYSANDIRAMVDAIFAEVGEA